MLIDCRKEPIQYLLAFSKGYEGDPRNSNALALFCEEKPKGTVIRRQLSRVYPEPRDFIFRHPVRINE